MKEYFEVDNNGNIVKVVLLDTNQEIPPNHLEGWGQGKTFYKPIYDFELGDWVESLTQEEIDEINNQPKELTETEKLKEELELAQDAINFLMFKNM